MDEKKIRRIGDICAISMIVIFLLLSIARTHIAENTLQGVLKDGGNDWSGYAHHALDIKHGGILMPSLKTCYLGPSGFLYNYFLALSFVLFGEDTGPVYALQHFILGLSIALIYWTFPDTAEVAVQFHFFQFDLQDFFFLQVR